MTANAPLQPIRFVVLTVLALATAAAASAQVGPPTFDKSFQPATLGPGSTSALVFDIVNPDPVNPVSGLAFSDTLPAGLVLATPAGGVTSCGTGLVTAADGGTTVSLTGGTLGAGAACTVRVDVTASTTPGVYTNLSGDLTSSAGNSGSATADLTVVAAIPGLSKTFAPATIAPDTVSTLTFTVDHSLGGANVFNVSFTDVFPTGLVVATPSNLATDCVGTIFADPGSTGVSLFSGFLAPGGVCTLAVDVTGTIPGDYDNRTSSLDSSAGSGGFAVDRLEIERSFLDKLFVGDPVAPGGTVTLEFTITNFDRRDAVTDLTFTDDLDATLSGLVALGLPANDVCGAGSQLTGSSLLTLTGGNLPAGGSCTFAVTLQVPAGAAAGTYPNTTSQLTGTRGGSPVTGDPASDTLTVAPVPSLSKTFLTSPGVPGGTVDMELMIVNGDPAANATAITFLDDLTAFLPGTTVVGLPQNDVCGTGSVLDTVSISGNLNLRLTGGNLGPGGSCTFTVTLQLPADAPAGTYTNLTGPVTATVGGESLTGAAASDDLPVVAAPILSKRFLPLTVLPGGTTTLEFTLDNVKNNPAGATGISFTDDLGAVLPGLVAVGLPANDVCGAGSQISGTGLLSFSGGDLGQGESCTFAVTVQVPAGAAPGTFTNTTGTVSAMILGLTVTSPPASAGLRVATLSLSKEFTDDPAVAGAVVNLRFVLTNLSPSAAVTAALFTDDLDAVLPGLAAVGLPANDVCGPGSQISGTGFLTLTNGNLPPLGQCTFDVAVQVPAGTVPGEYVNGTSVVTALFDGTPVTVPGATDSLQIFEALSIAKEFTDDPAVAGGTATLRFTLANADPAQVATGIAFSDDLSAALAGLAAVGLPANDVCGAGSQISGTGLLTLTGGNLPAGGQCSFDVTLQVPATVPFGTVAVNTTSQVSGTVGGVGVTGDPASDTLRIEFLAFDKAFDGPTAATGTPTLTFTIDNLDTTSGVGGLGFTDDLDAVLSGLVATGLPLADVCGPGSQLAGTSLLTLSGGNLGPGESCTFAVSLQVPAGAAPGSYPNATSSLSVGGLAVANPATDTLVVEPPPVFAKSFTPASIGLGGTSTLSLEIDNTASAVAASGLDVTDNLPAGMTVATPSGAATSCTGGTITAAPGSGVVSYTGGSVAAGAACTVQVTVTAGAAGALVNTTGDLTSSSGSSGTASATLTVNPQPGFAKAFAPGAIAPSGVSTLTFRIDNGASTVAATGVDFTDDLPGPVTVANPANATIDCTGTLTAVPGSGVVSFTGGTVAAGTVCTIQVDVTAALTGSFVNTSGNLTSSLGSSGTASDTLDVIAGTVAFAKAFAVNPVLRGGLIDLEYTVTNLSPDFALTAIAFSDDLEAALGGLVALGLPAADVCGAGSQLAGTSLVTLAGGNLAPGASCTFAVTLAVPATAPLGVFPSTTGTLTALASGVPVTADPAVADLEVVFLGLIKAFAAGEVPAGTTTELTFTLTNPDPQNAAAAIAFSDDLEAVLPGLTAVDLPQLDVCGTGSQLAGTSLVTLTGGSLPPGGSCAFTVTLLVPATTPGGSYTNLTSAVSAEVNGLPVAGDPAGAAEASFTVGANPIAIPTLGTLGLALLAGLLMAVALWRLRRGRLAHG